jgi:GGDEF domain-containing protein
VARIGGDEFTVLAVECDLPGAESLLSRLKAALCSQNVAASIGMSIRTASGSLAQALEKADQNMYEDKRCRAGDPASVTPT